MSTDVDLTKEERAKMRAKCAEAIKRLDELDAAETAGIAPVQAAAAGCTCSCDCDATDPSSTKASFHFGKNFASLGAD